MVADRALAFNGESTHQRGSVSSVSYKVTIGIVSLNSVLVGVGESFNGELLCVDNSGFFELVAVIIEFLATVVALNVMVCFTSFAAGSSFDDFFKFLIITLFVLDELMINNRAFDGKGFNKFAAAVTVLCKSSQTLSFASSSVGDFRKILILCQGFIRHRFVFCSNSSVLASCLSSYKLVRVESLTISNNVIGNRAVIVAANFDVLSCASVDISQLLAILINGNVRAVFFCYNLAAFGCFGSILVCVAAFDNGKATVTFKGGSAGNNIAGMTIGSSKRGNLQETDTHGQDQDQRLQTFGRVLHDTFSSLFLKFSQ